MQVNCKLIIRNDYQYIQHASALLDSIAKSTGLNEDEMFRIKFAFEETLTNTIESCMDEDEGIDIKIHINQISGGIEIVIYDNGLPFNPFRHDYDDSSVNLDTSRIEISSHLVHKMVDKSEFNNLGKKGKESRLVLYSDNFRINNLIDTDLSPKTDSSIDDRFKFVRITECDDAYDISTLFYKSYGYSYVNDVVYYPDRILEQISLKRLHSAVAVSEKGKIIGFVSLFESDNSPKITEWGMAVSDPNYRGQGIMTYNVDFIQNYAVSLNYIGIFAHSVTNHTFTQQVCAKYKFVTCALFIGYAPDLSFKKINSSLSQRESTFIDFKYFKIPENVRLFIPNKFADIVCQIYSNLGVMVEILEIANEFQILVDHQISEKVIDALNSVEIHIHSFGQNSVEYIKKITKQECLNRIDNIFLFLNLEDHHSMAHTEDIESLGYFFVGIFPEYVFRHTIVFQYINNTKYDFEKILSYSEAALNLKNFILNSEKL